jgi:metal-dependent amidase/aminoacylase/carboxypeptidase family protein
MLGGYAVRREADYCRGVPCLVNDDRILAPCVVAVRVQFGNDRIDAFEASAGGEDFALMAECMPSFQLKAGSGQGVQFSVSSG